MNKKVSDNIGLALEKISSDPKLTEDLVNQKTFDDLYNYCVSVNGGYTKEEFDEYMDDLVSMLEEQAINNLRINEDELRNISGGMDFKAYKNPLAYSLAFFVLAASLMPNTSLAVDAGTKVARRSSRTREYAVQKKSFWQRHKKKIIASGVLAVLALCWRWYNGAWFPHLSKTVGEGDKGSQGGGEAVAETPVDESSDSAPQASPPNAPAQPAPDGVMYSQPVRTDLRVQAEARYNRFFNWLVSKPGIGYLLLLAATAGVFIDQIAAVCRSFSSVISFYWSSSSLMENMSRWLTRRLNNMNNAPVGLTQSIDNLELLFDEVKGQEKAKEEVRSIVFNILHRKKHAQLTGQSYGHGDVLYFVGPSRVGKTLMARGLAKYKILSSYPEAYYVSASEIDKDSRKDTILDQLFGMNNYGGYGGYDSFGGGGMRAVSTPKNLVKYISEHPNGIVVVDEYDKMWSPALDEVFRTIVDNGSLNLKGQDLNCKNITFILTSNESTQSVRGGNQDEVKDIDDGTGSRTYIKHDKSFLNRIRPVEFENLSADVYEKILRTEFKRDLVDYWINPEVCGLDVVISDHAFANMAIAVEKKNQGAGLIPDLISDLFRDISIKVYNAELTQKGYYRGRQMFVDYDLDNNKFILTDGEKLKTENDEQSEFENKTPVDSNNDENSKPNSSDENVVSEDKEKVSSSKDEKIVPNDQGNVIQNNDVHVITNDTSKQRPNNDENSIPTGKVIEKSNNDESVISKGDRERVNNRPTTTV